MLRDGVLRLLVFRVGAELFAVELRCVREVVDAPAVHPVPDAPPVVLGVALIHDKLVTLYDPRLLLQVGTGAAGAAVLFDRGDAQVALAVDDVMNAMSIEREDIRPAPGAGGADEVLVGLVRRGRFLVGVIDPDALLAAAMTQAEGEREEA
jgi:purine-binding chemotaxis protein CheW